jgi:rubrerythrin
MANTVDNLKDAFAGESQASRKYTFFAEKADTAGNKQVAR